jgi:O-antigen/teichoic acid export membrane protein
MKRVVWQSAVYGLGNVATAALALFLVPLYTHRLTPAEFGVYSLMAMVYGVLSLLADAGLTNSIARYYFDKDRNIVASAETYRGELIATSVTTSTAISVLVSGACLVTAELLARRVFGESAYGPLLRIVAATVLFRGLTTSPMVYLRVTERPLAYAGLVLVHMALFLSCNLLFVLALDWGVRGVLLGQLVSTAVWAALALLVLRQALRHRPRWSIARELLHFGLPFLPVLLMLWVIDVSDRYLIQMYATTEDVGLYSLGYRFGQIMTFAVTAFTLGWAPVRFKILDRPDSRELYARVASLYVAGSGLVWMALSLFAEPMIALLAPPAFHPAAAYVAPVAFGYLVYGLFVLAVTGVGVAKETGSMPWLALAAATANVLLNLALLPRLGPMGAAYSTIVAYTILTLGSLWFSQRAYAIPYKYGQLLLLLGTAAALIVFGRSLSNLSWLLSAVVRCGLLGTFLLIVMAVGVARPVTIRGWLAAVPQPPARV